MTERKLRVFLCHSSQDKPVVRELYQRLHAEGWIDPWLDEEKLLPGQDWDMEIEKAVEAADAVIVCLSNNSVSKEGYVQRELKYVVDIALEKAEGTVFIIPLRLDECQIPRRLRSIQYIDYFPSSYRERYFSRVLQSLRNRADALAFPEQASKQSNVAWEDLKRGKSNNGNLLDRDVQKKLSIALFTKYGSIFGALLGLFSYFLPFATLRSNLSGSKFTSTGFELTFGLDRNFVYSPALTVIPLIYSMIILSILYSSATRKFTRKIGKLLIDGAALIIVTILGHIPWMLSLRYISFEPVIGFLGLGIGLVIILLTGLYQFFLDSSQNVRSRVAFFVQRSFIYIALLVAVSFLVYYADMLF